MPNLRSKTWTTTTPANVEDAQYWEDHLISDEAAAKAAGAVQNAFKRIVVQSGGSTTNVDASGEDTGLVLEAGSNVTLTATGKNIRIDSTGGGGGGGSYTAGKGIIISGDEIETDLKGYTLSTETAEAFGSTADRTYAVGLDANGDLAVNIPWTDTDTLDELGDVSLTTPADGDILRYSSEDSEWQNSDALSVAEGAIAKAYSTEDTASDDIATDDYIPFYDISESTKGKTTINNLTQRTVSNPNLLDNPWFTVNQRGKASYSGNDNYTVDRWQRRNTTDVTVDANGITIKSTRTGVQADTWFRQHICTNAEAAIRFIGKPLTATILFQDGTIEVLKANNYQGDISKSFTYNGCSMRMNLFNDTTQGTLQFLIWQFTYNVSVAIKAVKLEVGYISTLLLDTAPNYVDELLKCQYYFVRIKGISGSSIGNGWFTESNKAWMQAPLPRPLRSSTPTITLNGTMYVWSPTKLGSNGYQSTTVAASISNTNGSLFYQMQISGTETVGNCAMSQFRDTTSYLDVSADFY